MMYSEYSEILLMLTNVTEKFTAATVKSEVIQAVLTSDSNVEATVSSVVGSIKGKISDGIFPIGQDFT